LLGSCFYSGLGPSQAGVFIANGPISFHFLLYDYQFLVWFRLNSLVFLSVGVLVLFGQWYLRNLVTLALFLLDNHHDNNDEEEDYHAYNNSN